MKIVVGVDPAAAETETPVVDLLKRLRFDAPQFDITHIVPPPLYTGWEYDPVIAPTVLVEMEKRDCEAGRDVCAAVGAQLGGDTSVTVQVGNIVEKLMRHADETKAELLAINGTSAGPLVAFLSGSVARGLVIGAHQSVLIGKPYHDEDIQVEGLNRPLRAVLATDHSPYADRCVEKLMECWPRGLQHVTVLTVFPEDRLRAMEPMIPDMGVDPVEAVRESLTGHNNALIQKLSGCYHPMLTTFESRVATGGVAEAITQAMEETDSELLILGAHGHSFLERLTLGSVSFRQAVFSPYSVLVLRA